MSIKLPNYGGAYEGRVNKIQYTSTSVNAEDVTKLVMNHTTVWAKPYTLTLTLGEGVASVQVQRVTKTDPAGVDSTKTSSAAVPIFHGEVIKLTPTAKSNYTLTGTWPQTLTVLGNAAITVTATAGAGIQLQPPVIIDGGIGENKEIRQFLIYARVQNPNNVKVQIEKRLYNVKNGLVSNALASEHYDDNYEELAANYTDLMQFEDYSSSYGFKQWADPSIASNNGALIAVRCHDSNTKDSTKYLSSPYKFWSNKYNLSTVNASNNKITAPTVEASVLKSGGEYILSVRVSETWPFAIKYIFETPSGFYDSSSPQYSGGQLLINIDSLNGAVKVYLVDQTTFGFANSDVVTFNIADAEIESSSTTTAS